MPRSRRWLLPGVALLALIGVWLGHTLEYLRVWGTAGLGRELTSSTHLYMLPVGVGLTLLLAAVVGALTRLRRSWSRRLVHASGLLARAWRGAPAPATRATTSAVATPPSRRRLWLTLGLVLAVLQGGLYLIQENVETALAGAPAPGWSAVTGVHWAAPLIHAALGLALAAVAVAIWSLVRRREDAVERIERTVRGVLAALAARRLRPLLAPPTALRNHGAPALLGASIWCRPPPLALIP